jgi:hypothetical protein
MGDYLLLDLEDGPNDLKAATEWVSANLPRFFPDGPEKHPFDMLSPDQAIFTSADCLAEYKRAFGSASLWSIVTALPEPADDALRIVATSRWLEYARKESGFWRLGERIPLESGSAMETALSGIITTCDYPIQLYLIEGLTVPPALKESMRVMDVLALTPGTAAKSAKNRALFDSSRARKRRLFSLAAILACMVVAFAALNLYLFAAGASYRESRSADLAALKSLRALNAEDKKLAELLSGPSASNPGSPLAAAFLSALAEGLGANARLSFISYEKGTFNATVESPNALASVRNLERAPGFRSLLISSVRATAKGEEFGLTGSYHEAR